MSRACVICERGTVAGRQYSRRGMAKAQGGAGIKVTRKTFRTFQPNLQKIKIILNGAVQKALVCTKCIKSEKIVKA